MSQCDPADPGGEIGLVLARLSPAVEDFFARRVGSRIEAEDLTQEVMSRILKRATGSPIANVEGYVFQAAANLLREYGRQRTMRSSAHLIELGPEFSSDQDVRTPERIALGRDALRRVVTALYELPERTRNVFVLNRFEGMTAPEIAERLGISVSAVEKQMMRALAHLRGSQQ
ncbi:ECF subfamily RNA polymerase sigma-24 factor [Novosphingobium sp. Rr 2-17]|uniref:RNA polymerase sigma factor n=1 Tax=Novosphingobium sp. Rr 2-17 TaxID=555793 RepID=UPI0002698220|nr:sigma-70 family RNA polymerase sigma factor [Novosphingobium sp. Rr 2-17]EIZ78378.1 ECF subfamily RNA polymerase sigma-24 factor [Novosphingobium sp. Rr 2-17]